jgi:hypothetical protein
MNLDDQDRQDSENDAVLLGTYPVHPVYPCSTGPNREVAKAALMEKK